MAAGRAAQLGASVLLVEKMKTPGRKLAITGKGRCNITNNLPIPEFLKNVYPNGGFLRTAFGQFYSQDIIQLLADNGVEMQLERGGRYFPKSNKATDVVDALVNWATNQGVVLQCGARLQNITTNNNKVAGVSYIKGNETLEQHCDSVILCTGGFSYPATGSTGDGHKQARMLGHVLTDSRPALVPLETLEPIDKVLQSLNLRNVKASLWVNHKKADDEFGELTFMDFGLSGPVIISLSRQAVDALNSGLLVEVSLDLKPALDDNKLDARLLRDIDQEGKKQVTHLFKKWLPKQLIPAFTQRLAFNLDKPANQLSGKERKSIRVLLKDFRYTISSFRSFKESIVTAGGVKTTEIRSKTMESKKVENLYFAGELIDLDAKTGGFNLQIAFSTGWLAGTSAAEK